MYAIRSYYAILETFNDTAVDFPAETTMFDLLEDHLADRPDRIAAVYKNGYLTYKELLTRGDALAARLRAMGRIVGSGSGAPATSSRTCARWRPRSRWWAWSGPTAAGSACARFV